MKKVFALGIIAFLALIMSVNAFAAEVDATPSDARPHMDYNNPLELIDSDYNKIAAYKIIPDYDVNEDGKVSIVDVKAVLKHIAGTSVLADGAENKADADKNGRISTADAKLMLQYIAGLKESYALEDGTLLNGTYKNQDGGVYYFNEQGIMAKGITEIDGEKYLFSYDGVMLTQGIQSYNSKNYLILNDNTVACGGFFEYKGKKYLADEDGVLAKGRKSYNGKTYLFDENCALVINSSALENGVLYFTDEQGVLLNGTVKRPDGTYLYENGRPYSGWKYPGLDMFFYDKNGKLAVNTTIGDFTFDANGYPSATVINHNTLRYHLRKILKQYGSDPGSIFNYITNHDIFSYKVMEKGASAEEMVIYMLKYHKGSCYQYAYFTQALYKEAGIECEVVIGTVVSTTTKVRSTHYWNKVKFSDGWYYVDTEYPWQYGGVYKKTADEMKELSYRW